LYWRRPDARWERGEIIDNPIALSLDGLPPGEYATWVGWRQNGAPDAAVPAYDESGHAISEPWVKLPTTIIVP
jgi:hypothetical protein